VRLARCASLRRVSLLLPILLGLACDAPPDAEGVDSGPAPPISGATLDAIQSELAASVALRTDRARIQRSDEGRHLVIHVTPSAEVAETELAAACGGIREVLARHLVPGQSADVYFLKDGGVAHACESEES
jgi:hypothetical protein